MPKVRDEFRMTFMESLLSTLNRWIGNPNLRIGSVTQRLTSRWWYCLRCGTTLIFVDAHNTWYKETPGERVGCKALCKKCWRELPPEERLPFYTKYFSQQLEAAGDATERLQLEQEQELIVEAVLQGK